jgi:hypothetical protein
LSGLFELFFLAACLRDFNDAGRKIKSRTNLKKASSESLLKRPKKIFKDKHEEQHHIDRIDRLCI